MSSCQGCGPKCTNCISKRQIATNTSDSASPKVALKSTSPKIDSFFNSVITNADLNSRNVDVKFSNGETHSYPLVWLRDNCQCHDCFEPKALGRSFLMDGLNLQDKPSNMTTSNDGKLEIIWEDGHKSIFNPQWLHERAFNDVARQRYRTKFMLPKVATIIILIYFCIYLQAYF